MAVKKPALVAENSPIDLTALAKQIEVLTIPEPNFLPEHELIKICQDLVQCLSQLTVDDYDLIWHQLQTVEDLLLRLFNTVHEPLRKELIIAILEELYIVTSDPQTDSCPAASVVLIVFASSAEGEMLSSARFLVQMHGEDVPATPGAGLPTALACLYRWVCEWKGTPGLPDWTLVFMRALEENHVDILISVTLDNIEQLFLTLETPRDLRLSTTDVIFTAMACMRKQPPVMERLAAHVRHILDILVDDSGQYSRQLLQHSVDILADHVQHMRTTLHDMAAYTAFRERYGHVVFSLERHMASNGCHYLHRDAWVSGQSNMPPPVVRRERVGLVNMGNTCYMNSVIQALFVTRQFSNHVVMHMLCAPYWSRLCELFAKMLHSHATTLIPEDLYKVIRPPTFDYNHQHDSSEFLGYLFEILRAFEDAAEDTFDYSCPPNRHKLPMQDKKKPAAPRTVDQYTSTQDLTNDNSGNNSAQSEMPLVKRSPRRSASPRPGSSRGATSTKRHAETDSGLMSSSRKCSRLNNDNTSVNIEVRRESVIDKLFGGVMVTRFACTECAVSSVTTDVFRDLQLAFPEKIDGTISVQRLLEYYCSDERLRGDNMYMCSGCEQLREADRTVSIEHTPKYLILVLKNFRYDQKTQAQKKLLQPVDYNLTVRLPAVRCKTVQRKYHLYAAVVHSGTTLDSGHYYTISIDDEGWHTYNDDKVSFTRENGFRSMTKICTPYILFYRRQDVAEPKPPEQEELPARLQQIVVAHNKFVVDSVQRMSHTP